MLYVKNLPVWERLLRSTGALALALYAVIGLDGAGSWVALAAATGLLASAIFGFCPACAMVGRRLKE